MMLRARWSAPANLLLVGEYAVTRPGGAGIAVALSPRGQLVLYEKEHPEYAHLPEGFTGTGSLTVVTMMGRHGDGGRSERSSPLVAAVFDTLIAEGYSRLERNWRIEIDTSSFFEGHTGNKLGLGSSAVASLLLTTALLEIAHIEEGQRVNECAPESSESLEQTVRIAVNAHRAAHGGRGSGYDIVTSAVGGSIRFVGGVSSHWTPTWGEIPFLSRLLDNGLTLHTWSSAPAVASGSAVGCFDTVIPPRSDAERAFIQHNNNIVDTVEAASEWKSLFSAFQKAVQLGRDLGERIGVSAELPYADSHVDDGWISKASGAGNERGIIVAQPRPRRRLPRGTIRVFPEPKGLTCLYRNNGN